MKKIVIKSIFFNLMILRRKIEFYILLIVFFIFLSCSRNSLSNGGGTDIGNPAKICVVDSLDQPVKDASVKVIAVSQIVKERSILIHPSYVRRSIYKLIIVREELL
ncbi:MAG: hypothetical protein N2053_01275 [Chitinispirillaceae bacterium]|nr:hypothetical protein [Chitinispirillaceae bacterium]